MLFDQSSGDAAVSHVCNAYVYNVIGAVVGGTGYVRNIGAHHGRLWNKQITVEMAIPKSPVSLRMAMNQDSPRLLYNTLAAICYMMVIVAHGTMWRQEIVKLMDSCELENPKATSFPENRRTLPAWSQQCLTQPAAR